MGLEEIRQEINTIDDELVRLFVRRMQATDAIAETKRASGAPVTNLAREREILSKVAQAAGPEFENEARFLFSTLMAMSRGRQRAERARANEGPVRRRDLAVALRSGADGEETDSLKADASGKTTMEKTLDVAGRLMRFPKAKKAVLVTDSNVDRLYGDAVVRQLEDTGLRVERVVFPAGEPFKSLETYFELVRSFASLGLTRTDFAIALGGGVVGDVIGFAAATYLRGIDFVQVPTSLMAMVDSSIGGKTGVNIPEGKNLVGAFHQPRQIICDTGFLATLPDAELKNGFAEMIKTAVLFDADLFATLRSLSALDRDGCLAQLGPLVTRTAAWKEQMVEADFREGGRRRLLNLGHTFGHAFEMASRFRLSHGEAVALGLRLVGRDVPAIGEILDAYGFPTISCDADICRVTGHGAGAKPLCLSRTVVLEAVTRDKKRSGDVLTLVVPRAVGSCELVETPIGEVGRWLR